MVQGFITLMAVFAGGMSLVALFTLSCRMDKAERRHAYETECLIRSLPSLEQQNLMLQDKLNNYMDARASLAQLEGRSSSQQLFATEDEVSTPVLPRSGRVIH